MEGKRWIPTFVGMTETSNEIATLSSKGHDDRGININKIYLQMGKMCKVCGIKPS
ncbi:MAG: hypothetical protein MUO55_03250 [Candidatus Atribacteria bacterium]|nr:hypothetical protein [Candidatus Atribacteria bacterium]